MGHLNDFLTHVAESFTNLFNLDADPALTERENVERVIDQSATVACIASIVLPIPAADFVVLTPIQAKMTLHIGRIKGFDVGQERAQQILKEILGVLGMTLTAHLLIVSVSKFVPLGGILTVPLIYAATWAIGNVVDYYFDCMRSGQDPSAQTMKDLFAEQFRVGKRRGQDLDRDELQRKAEDLRRRVVERDASMRTKTRLDPRGAAGAATPAPTAGRSAPQAKRPKIKITLPGRDAEPAAEEAPTPVRKTIGPEPSAPAPPGPAAEAPAPAQAPRDEDGEDSASKLVAQLERLARLREAGVLDQTEFEQAKRRLLS